MGIACAYPQGQTLTLTYDAQYRIVAVTDALGQVSTLQYAVRNIPTTFDRRLMSLFKRSKGFVLWSWRWCSSG